MSLDGLVNPERKKCESLNWRWVRAHQMAPQGLGPAMYQKRMCTYGEYAPYKSQQEICKLNRALPFRIWGYPNVTQCSRLAPLLYYRNTNSIPKTKQN